MSYDNSNMVLGDIETIVLCNQSRDMHCDLLLWAPRSIINDSLIANDIFTKRFDTYSATHMFLGQPGICQFISLFISSSILPGVKTTPRSGPGIFLKILHFLGESRSPHRGTETGCLRKAAPY